MENLKSLITFGNTKLPKTTAIFNFGSATNCPSKKLGLCELSSKCYALKAEKMYKACLPFRERQYKYWKNCTPEQFCNEFTEIYKHKKIKPTLLRFNESGDFYGLECYYKAEKIAQILKTTLNVTCYAYTHRTDLTYYNNFPFLNLLKSGFNHNDYLAAKYVAVKKELFEETKKDIEVFKYNSKVNFPYQKKYICKGSCKTCNLCATIKAGTIYTKLH